MVTIPAAHQGAIRVSAPGSQAACSGDLRGFLRYAFHVLRGVLGSLFAAELVLPEAEPARVRALLIELEHLDAAAPQEELRTALASFQLANGLPPNGTADGRTVSILVKAARELWELQELGLPPNR